MEATIAAIKRSQVSLPDWVVDLIKAALSRESVPLARSHLSALLENLDIASSNDLPICQDTGILVFHIEKGTNVHLNFDLKDAVAEAVRQATSLVPLRPNVVHPLTRSNTKDNTGEGMPYIITDEVNGSDIRVSVYPKGAGSENMSFLGMLNPADDPFDFIVDEISKRAPNACPPIFVGVGIGGTFDYAALLSKKALFHMPGTSSLEMDLLNRINCLKIGPMGLGGDTTALGVKIEIAGCHTASLPVAVNVQCWAHRCAQVTVSEEGWSID